jgi:hypothetical protein
MSNPTVIPSPIMGITAWAISPASAGTRFWCGNNNAQTPNKDSLATPAGAKTNFSLSNIDTPNGLFSSFWTGKQNGLDTPKLASEAQDSDFVDLDASKPEPSNSILDVMDMKMPPTPKKQQQQVSLTEHRRREVNLGDYSIVQQTQVSLVPNVMLNKNMNGAPLPTLPSQSEYQPSAPKRRLVQLATPSTIHQNFKLETVPQIKTEAASTPASPQIRKTPKKQPKEKKYACNWENCTKAFYRADELKRHTRVHTKEKPFPCPHCDRHFARSDHVRTHVRIHTGEKPYKCKYCPKSFARSDERLRHHKVHEKRTKKEQDAKNNQRKMEVMGYHAPQHVCQSRSSTPNSVHHHQGYSYQPPQPVQFRNVYHNAPATPVMINGSPVVQSQTYYPQSNSRNASYESSSQYGHYYN